MKGPGLRLNGDVRRVWRCPACGSELPSVGAVTSRECRCEKPYRFMQLVEPRRTSRPEPKPLDVYFECEAEDESATAEAVVSEQVDDAVPASDVEAVPASESVTESDSDAAESEVVAMEATQPEPQAAAAETTPAQAVPTETSPVEPAPAEPAPEGSSSSTAETPPSGKAEESQQKRKRKSRRGRRRRGRRRDAGDGLKTDSGGGDPS